MEKRILSWGLILSLLLTLLPVSAMATEGEVSGDGLSVTESTPCTCGAESDAEGIVTHAEGCPFAVQGDTTPGTEGSVTGTEEPTSEMEEPATGTEEPTSEMEEPVTGTEEPTSEMEEPVTGTEEPTPETEEPVTGTEEPTPETEKPVPGTEEPAPGTEEPVPGTEEPAPGTEESAPQLLTPPILTCEPLDEENSSDMVLTVEGEWDSYAWESCSYGSWSDWAGDGPNLILSKEEFTSYGFRCTVTQGEQLVTSEIFAYDLSVLERPMLMANGLADDSLSGSSDYIKFGKRLPNSTFFDIKGLDHGHEIRTTYADAGYRTAISVNGGTKMSVFYRGEPVSVGNSLTAETSLEIVYGGRYVKVNYEVTNNGSTTQNFRIGSSADVMIDNNDYAKVVGVKSSTGKYTGLSMSGSPKNNYQFSLIAPDCDTLWYGYYSKAYINIFNDLSNKDTPYSKDSGMAWSWDGTVAPGQTWSRYVFIGAGELPPVPDAPLTNAFPTLKAGEEFTISGMVSPSGNPPDTVHVSIGGEEYEAMVNEDGTFTVTGTLPENMPEGESVLTYWGTTDEGGISEIKSSSVTVVAAPYISLTTSSVTVMEGETGLNEAWLKAFIKSHSDTVNISPSNIDTNTPGEMTVTYKVEKDGFTPASAQLTVTVLPQPAELTQATVSESAPFVLTATMKYTGGLTYTATGFVYGAVQNPTLSLYDGKIPTDPLVDNKGGTISVSVADSALAYGVTYYARAYAISSDGTVIYSKQSAGFGKGIPSYGTFSVAYAGTIDNKTTFTITRTGGTDGKQTVYYRTINGSAIGETHFEHQAGSITFQEGETSKNIPVTEKSVTSIYDGNAATAYSNADRTYSLEIYRVVGGATINSSQKSASRTMVVSNSYYVDDDLFNVYQASAASGLTTRGDFDDDKLGWSDDEDIGAAASSTVNFSTLLPQREYWKTVAQELWYRFYMEAKEIDGGYQHIQF
ncbi:MAG: Calx-beta domain-containing protein, partial [Lawsonibacter sp.]